MSEIYENVSMAFGILCIAIVLCIPIVKSTRWYRVHKFHEMRDSIKLCMDTYEIRRSDRLFGSFWDSDAPNAVVRAYDARHALQRYFARYRRRNKEYHEYDGKTLLETTYSWGVFQVKNTRTGFKRYYK